MSKRFKKMEQTMTSKIVALLAILLIEHAAGQVRLYGEEKISCTNGFGQKGECRHVKVCEPILDYINVHGKSARSFVVQSLCSIDSVIPIVCCPDSELKETVRNNDEEMKPDLIEKLGKYRPLESPMCGQNKDSLPRVVDGNPAELGVWPWVALLRYRSKDPKKEDVYLCGGVLISARHVLTAAHCVYKRKDLYHVRLGELDTASINDGADPKDYSIERVDVHKKYNSKHFTNDIAVIKINQDVEFTENIYPICLPTLQELQGNDFKDKRPFVVGWGAVHYNGPKTTKLLQITPPVVPQDSCKKSYDDTGVVINDNVICAGKGGMDACQGDSGGPMMFPVNGTWYSIGIVSFGFRCALANHPGVYTKTEKYLDFILSSMY